MDPFAVQMTQAAVDDLESIHPVQREQILSAIKSLSTNPLPSGIRIKKLKGFKPPLYRLRSGDFRILYRIQSNDVTIMNVLDRKDLEKIIKRLQLQNPKF